MMNTEHNLWFVFALSVLAVFRLSTMFAVESGPGRIFRKLRGLPEPKSATKEGLSCSLCQSVWWAAGATGFLYWQEVVAAVWAPTWWLAISGGAVLLAPLHLVIMKR